MQRPAEQRDPSDYRPAARKPDDELSGDRIEHRTRDVFLRCPRVQERSNIHLRKDRASRGYGVDLLASVRKHVERLRVHIQHTRDRIDESSRTAGACVVHPQLFAAGQKQYLRILPADLNGNVGLGNAPAHGGAGGDHLLNERQAEDLGKLHTRRSRNGNGHLRIGKMRDRVAYRVAQRFLDVREVSFIRRMQKAPCFIEHGELHGFRSQIDAEAQCPAFGIRCHHDSSQG